MFGRVAASVRLPRLEDISSVESDDQAEPKLSHAAALRLTKGLGVSAARGLEMSATEFFPEPVPTTFACRRGVARIEFPTHSRG